MTSKREKDRLTDGHPLDFCMGEGDAQVVEGEHAMEWLYEEEDLRGGATGQFSIAPPRTRSSHYFGVGSGTKRSERTRM